VVPEGEPELPTGKDLTRRWGELSRIEQGELFRRIRRAEPGRDEHDAILIAAMAQHRLKGWTMRPEVVLPLFVAFFAVLSLVRDDFSFSSALSAPLIYALYLFWMRSVYKRAYRHNMAFLRGEEIPDI
jgi:hypothetical protein